MNFISARLGIGEGGDTKNLFAPDERIIPYLATIHQLAAQLLKIRVANRAFTYLGGAENVVRPLTVTVNDLRMRFEPFKTYSAFFVLSVFLPDPSVVWDRWLFFRIFLFLRASCDPIQQFTVTFGIVTR